MGAPEFVPYHVILLAPRVGAVEGQSVVVAVGSLLFPVVSHLTCLLHILVGNSRQTFLLRHHGIGSHAHDGFDGEVGIVSPVTGKVVGAELFGRVLTVLCQIVCPGSDDVPILVDIGRAGILSAQFGSEDEHVASLFDRHVGTIDLSVGDGVGAQVVGSKRFCPAPAIGIVENGRHHGFLQFRVVAEKERCLGVGEVYRVDAAVGVVLLREEEQVALVVLEELVGSDDMAIDPRQHLCIVGTTHLEGVVVDAAVEVSAALHDAGILRIHAAEQLEDADRSFVGPVGLVAVEHVFNVLHLVVAYHHVAGSTAGASEVVGIAEQRLGSVVLDADLPIDGGQIEIAPVDADGVALLGQDGLFDGACAHIADPLLTASLRTCGLVGVGNRQ